MRVHVNKTDLDIILKTLSNEIPDAMAWLSGSRITDKGPSRNTADLDLVLASKQPIKLEKMLALEQAFTACGLPFAVDVFDWAKLTRDLKQKLKKNSLLVRKIEKQ